ncbi:MAG: NADH-quinone oxidoreductase subunit G [Actinomycetes bacterium]
MTATTNSDTNVPAVPADSVTVTVDGRAVSVPKGSLVIRAAEVLGIEIPRFCDHPLLEPVAACRMCLVEIAGQPKPQPACAVTVTDGMAVLTQAGSAMAEAAQRGVLEFLLINHPLDCPVCDKGGECPLQNQSLSHGRGESRFDGVKRTFEKPISVSAQVLLDRERCVSCARCTRFADEIAGDPFISLQERGAKQQVGIGDESSGSYFSGNVIQICPVGALTSARYRFRTRPFDLVSVTTTCEHCAAGCELRTDYRRGTIMRRQAGDAPAVNEEWNCDKGRFAFTYVNQGRLSGPLVRDAAGDLVAASWPEAIAIAAAGLASAAGRVGVLTGGRLSDDDALTYSRFARAVLKTDDVDFRARTASAEEADFLAAHVAGTGLGVTYADLESAPAVLLVDFEPEDESPIVYLRLRKAVRTGRTRILAVAPFTSDGLAKLSGTLFRAAPGEQPAVLDRLASDESTGLRQSGAVILVGERLAGVVGGLTAVARLATATGARLAWVPRRAGERGALDAGLLPGLLPGGRPLTDATARAEIAAVWAINAADLPTTVGRDLGAQVAAVHQHQADLSDGIETEAPIGAWLIAGVGPEDLPDPTAFLAAVAAVPFVVSLETRHTEITALADVVLPVAAIPERAGSFTNWEGRVGSFSTVLSGTGALTDARVLTVLAEELGTRLGGSNEPDADWAGARRAMESVTANAATQPGRGQALLTGWRQLIDAGTLQEGEPFLAATARPAVARISAATAANLGLAAGSEVTVSTGNGRITLPWVPADLPDAVVWLPLNSADSAVRSAFGAAGTAGAIVGLSSGGAA